MLECPTTVEMSRFGRRASASRWVAFGTLVWSQHADRDVICILQRRGLILLGREVGSDIAAGITANSRSRTARLERTQPETQCCVLFRYQSTTAVGRRQWCVGWGGVCTAFMLCDVCASWCVCARSRTDVRRTHAPRARVCRHVHECGCARVRPPLLLASTWTCNCSCLVCVCSAVSVRVVPRVSARARTPRARVA